MGSKVKLAEINMNNNNNIIYVLDELISSDLNLFYQVLSPYGLKLDCSDFIQDVEVREDGVYIPTEYKISYRGSNQIDDPEEWKPIDFQKRYSIDEFKKLSAELN